MFGCSASHEDYISCFEDGAFAEIFFAVAPEALADAVIQILFRFCIGHCCSEAGDFVWAGFCEATFDCDEDFFLAFGAFDVDAADEFLTDAAGAVEEEGVVLVVEDAAAGPHAAFERLAGALVGVGAVGEHVGLAFGGFEVEEVVGDGEFFGELGWREDWRWIGFREEVGEGHVKAVT